MSAPKEAGPLAIVIRLEIENPSPFISSNACTRLDALRLDFWLRSHFELAAIVDLTNRLREIAEREQTR